MDDQNDIYTVCDTLIEKIEKDKEVLNISLEFNKIKSNSLKVKYVLNLLIHYNHLPGGGGSGGIGDIIIHRKKDNSRARELRQTGNKFFSLKGVNLFKALEHYNQSICFAEIGSEDFGIGVANRSAVYFEWKMYDNCMDNIQLAKNSGYPTKLMDKILKRELECIAAFTDKLKPPSKSTATDNEMEFNFNPKLSFKSHEKIPFIARQLELKENAEFGRYIITNEKINPGKVIAIEEPYIKILLPAFRYQRCTNCLSESSLNLLPCRGCTSAMFCSEQCFETAISTYHRFECSIIDGLFLLFNKIQLSAIRTCIKSVIDFDYSFEKLSKFLDKFDIGQCTTTTTVGVNSFTSIPKDYETDEQRKFHEIFCLDTNESKRTPSELFQRAIITACTYHILITHTELGKLCESSSSSSSSEEGEKSSNLFIDLLFRFSQISSTNFHGISFDDHCSETVQYGAGAYPFSSLINHSCAPNVARFSYGTKLILVALRPLKPGDQLFDNYGYHHCLHSKQLRQKNLQLQYHFVCECIACRENYPPFANLQNHKNLVDIVTNTEMEGLQTLNRHVAASVFGKYSHFLLENDSYYPCLQLSNVQECFKVAFDLLINNIPLSLQQH